MQGRGGERDDSPQRSLCDRYDENTAGRKINRKEMSTIYWEAVLTTRIPSSRHRSGKISRNPHSQRLQLMPIKPQRKVDRPAGRNNAFVSRRFSHIRTVKRSGAWFQSDIVHILESSVIQPYP